MAIAGGATAAFVFTVDPNHGYRLRQVKTTALASACLSVEDAFDALLESKPALVRASDADRIRTIWKEEIGE